MGSTVTTITANDVDTHPVLRYSLVAGEEGPPPFVVDRFSGRLLLAQPLDYERQREYRLRLHVSDTEHLAETTVTVHVLDANDHAPRFLQPAYQVSSSILRGLQGLTLPPTRISRPTSLSSFLTVTVTSHIAVLTAPGLAEELFFGCTVKYMQISHHPGHVCHSYEP